MCATPSDRHWAEAPLSELIDHILVKHHQLDENLPRLIALAAEVAGTHAAREPRLVIVEKLLKDLVADLEPHLEEEEQLLFPWIRRGEGRGVALPVKILEEEHEHVDAALRRIRAFSADFVVPAMGSDSWRALWAGLEALEADLHEHIHLESELLFPRALR